MHLATKQLPILFASSLSPQRHHAHIHFGPSSRSARFSTNQPSSSHDPIHFPFWIRLKGMSNFENRQRVTTEVADSISASGGFLTNSNILSDLVTVMTMEDVDPHRVGQLQDKLQQIEGFRLNAESEKSLEDCQTLLQSHETVRIPPSVYCNLQITWLNAPGKLRQEIVADG